MTDSERRLLAEIVERRQPALRPQVDALGTATPNDSIVQDLRLLVADELLDFGLDASGEHNDHGRQLERLISSLGEFMEKGWSRASP